MDITIPNENLKEFYKEDKTNCANDLIEGIVCAYLSDKVEIFNFGLDKEPAIVELQMIDDINTEGEDDDAEDGFWDDTFDVKGSEVGKSQFGIEEARPAPKSAPKEAEEAQKHLTTPQGQNAQSSTSPVA